MKTVFKAIGLSGFLGVLCLGIIGATESFASGFQPAPGAASNDAVSNLAAAASAVAATTAAPAAAAPGAAPVMVPPTAAPAVTNVSTDAVADAPDDKSGSGIEAQETGVPKSVNAIVKHLGKESENLTLNDLNSARQAIAKIETLIELEKKLTELEKVQRERQGKTSANTIPASMLMPPPSPVQNTQPITPPPMFMSSDVDIDRIVGGEGNYRAVIKSPDGSTKTMQVGDSLPDGGVVSKISASAVEVTHGSTKQTIHVKNVDVVFGGSP